MIDLLPIRFLLSKEGQQAYDIAHGKASTAAMLKHRIGHSLHATVALGKLALPPLISLGGIGSTYILHRSDDELCVRDGCYQVLISPANSIEHKIATMVGSRLGINLWEDLDDENPFVVIGLPLRSGLLKITVVAGILSAIIAATALRKAAYKPLIKQSWQHLCSVLDPKGTAKKAYSDEFFKLFVPRWLA